MLIASIYDFDFAVNDWIANHLTADWLDPVMRFITTLGDAGIFWILLAVILLCFKKTRRMGAAMAISLIISTLITNLTLKPLINRPRPYELRTIEGLDTSLLPGDASFPSGHTTVSFSGAFALFWQNKKAGAPALALATLIAFSRLYFYLHHPTDILGGILVGLAASLLSRLILPYAERGANELLTTYRQVKALKKQNTKSNKK